MFNFNRKATSSVLLTLLYLRENTYTNGLKTNFCLSESQLLTLVNVHLGAKIMLQRLYCVFLHY